MSIKKKYWLGYENPSDQDKFFIEALDENIWSAGSKNDWDACWATEMPNPSQFETLDANKTINHIPGNNALTIKGNLYTTLHKAKLAVKGMPQEERYSFFPYTYAMPKEYYDFQQAASEKPGFRWIQKPTNMSRGRGIEVVQHPETVPLGSQWIIQEYLDRPHLWNGFKYVLRCYVLITSIEPLRFYWYHEGSAKLTSAEYDLDDLDNPYRHLTNPDINEHNTEADVPVIFHSFRVYKEWLHSEGIDDKKIYAQIEDLISLTVIASREKMRNQTKSYKADMQGAYELMGLDLVIDSDLKPWILECNLSPSLDICSSNEAQAKEEIQTKKGMVTEIVNMLGLNDTDQASLNRSERAERELDRAKGFKCLFPNENANNYLNCFPIPRFADVESLANDFKIDYDKLSLQSQSGTEAVFDDSLALLAHDTITQDTNYIIPNEIATWIWIQNSEGNNPDEIAQELTEAFGSTDAPSYLAQTWNMLADWSQANLFSQTKIQNNDFTDTKDPLQTWESVGFLNYSGLSVEVRCACSAASSYMKNFTDDKAIYAKNKEQIDIMRSDYGYQLINKTEIIASGRKLSRLMNTCIEFISKNILKTDDIALIRGLVVSLNNKNALIIGNSEQLDGFGYEFCLGQKESKLLSGYPILSAKNNTVTCTDFPLLLPSNTDTISSSYDPSNYYPQKPKTGNSKDQAIVKSDWFISETPYQPCWLAPANAVVGDQAKIDAVIFLEISKGEQEQLSINEILSANTIAKLWINSINKKSTTAGKLPEWLTGIQAYSVKSIDLKQAKSMISVVADTLFSK